jgi:predicted nucleic acid-binding protein
VNVPRGLYLIDTSAWARMHEPTVTKRLTAVMSDGAAATCLPLDLEDGRSARNFRDALAIRGLRAKVMTELPITAGVAARSRNLQLALARRGHRAASSVDLITAAVAAEHDSVVLHYDRDYDLIADIGGPRSEWVVPAGALG